MRSWRNYSLSLFLTSQGAAVAAGSAALLTGGLLASSGQLDPVARFLEDVFNINRNDNTCDTITCPTLVSTSSASRSTGSAWVINDLRYCTTDLTSVTFKYNGNTFSCVQSGIGTCTTTYTFPEITSQSYCCSTAECRVTPTTQPTIATISNAGTVSNFAYCPSDLSTITFTDSTNSINYVCTMGTCTGSKGVSITSVTGSVTDVTGPYCCFANCPVSLTLGTNTLSIGFTTSVSLASGDIVTYCPSDRNSLTIRDTSASNVYTCTLVGGSSGLTSCTASTTLGSITFTTQLVGITGANTYCCSKTS